MQISGSSVRFLLVGIVVLLLGGFSSGQTVSLSPKSGPPTTKLSISGSGFSANSAVDIYFDTTDEALVITDGTGAIAKTTLKAPASAVPGQHWVSAVQRSTGTGSQAAFTVQTNWAQQGFGPSHQGWNSYENVLNTSNVGSLDLLWTNKFGTEVESSLSVVGNRIYFASNSDEISAAKTSNGSFVWNFGTSGNVETTPAVGNGQVCAGSTDNNIYLLNATTGAVSQSFSTGGYIVGSPTVSNGLCYLGSADNNVYAMYLSDGFIPWVYITGGPIVSSPAAANGIVYISSEDGNLYALNASNGSLIWQYNTGGYQGTSPIVANGLVFVPSNYTQLFAIYASSGQLAWSLPVNLPYTTFQTQLAAANSLLYFFSANTLYAVHVGTSTVSWADSFGSDTCVQPSVANGVLYIGGCFSGLIYAIDAANGNILWQYGLANESLGAPAIVNGTVYAGDIEGNLYAFGLPASAAPKAPVRPTLASLSPNLDLKP
ncbi:MAG TPA: PQQ-binding-like beta-propeller repeat protein [Candidatus Sulfotelmatobacter sp.]|nr:PQQ-binding-like beta-propeller repeat protein [Candidatus Sulfotelmatobacter sp.]